MYITYDTSQWELKDFTGLLAGKRKIHSRPRRIIRTFKNVNDYEGHKVEEASEFKPTRLVRVSDMEVVPGPSVVGRYWALSYSWNQSGEVIHKGSENYERIDEGEHRIITHDTSGRERIQTVKFEGLIQHVCMDFGIDYIWYDQMCINQEDAVEKMQEIKQMHMIYSNAWCTVALVPELHVSLPPDDPDPRATANTHVLPETQWSKRMWTLEEAYMSQKILYLGQNVHIWSDITFIWWAAFRGGQEFARYRQEFGKSWMACTALWHARKRTSSRRHDQIFALANILPELMDDIKINYEQPLLKLQCQFYGLLVQQDASVLLFGKPIDPDLRDNIAAERERDARFLPSWCGASGTHVPQFPLQNCFAAVRYQCMATKSFLYIESDFIRVSVEAAASVDKSGNLGYPQNYTEDGLPRGLFLGIYHVLKTISMWFTLALRELTFAPRKLTFVPTTSDSQNTYDDLTRGYGLKATHFLPLKVGEHNNAHITLSNPTHIGGFLSLTKECSDCIILFTLKYPTGLSYTLYPVVEEDNCSLTYESVGVCLLNRELNYGSFVQFDGKFAIV